MISTLKAARLALGLSVEALRRLLGGVDEGTVRRWERGALPPPPAVMVLLDLLRRSPEARRIVGLAGLQAAYPVRRAGRPKAVKPAA